MIKFDRFYGGKHFAVTFSFDDCNVADRKLIQLLNKYNLKGTFHLISGRFDHETVVTKDEVKSLYANHEIACHTLDHPHMERLPYTYQVNQMIKDKINLEEIAGYIVRGFSYPYNAQNEFTVPTLESLGIAYARVTDATFGFSQPGDLMNWKPSCHYKDFDKLYPRFIKCYGQTWNYGSLFYIWGHSYEMEDANEWDKVEDMCKKISDLDDTWYATNIEIADYIKAQKSLIFSANCKKVLNPSIISVWISKDGQGLEIKPGETIDLGK